MSALNPTPIKENDVQDEYVSEAVLSHARRLVKEFFTECFWFWNPSAKIEYKSDVKWVIRHLREYGNQRAWHAAQKLKKCL